MSISAGRYVVVDVSSEDFLKNAIFRLWQKYLHIYLRAASWPCIFLLKVRPAILKYTMWEKYCQFLCGKKQQGQM